MRALAVIGLVIWMTPGPAVSQTPLQGNPQAAGSPQEIPFRIDRRPPRLSSKDLPSWPEGSKAKGGRVQVSWDLNNKGGIKNVVITDSSGDADLDQATLAWAQGVTFEPSQTRTSRQPDWQPGGYRDYRATCIWQPGQPPRLIMGS